MALMQGFLRSKIAWTLLGIAFLFTMGRMARRQLAKDPRFNAYPHEIRAAAPKWGGTEVLQPLQDRLRALGPLNLFRKDFADAVRDALDEVPGIKVVRDVRRHWPNRYSVAVTLHRPYAVVVRGRRAIPVTADGVVLPAGPYRTAMRGLQLITGIDDAPPALGRPWHSEQLADGLATLRQLEPHADELVALGIAEIDVGRSREPLEGVLLHGRDETSVRWGRPRATVGENPVARKIGFLRLAASHLAQVRGQEIDVRYSDIYVRESSTP